jgi:hypothetical protein
MLQKKVISVLLLACLIGACQTKLTDRVETSLTQTMKEFGVTDYCYLVTDNEGNVQSGKKGNNKSGLENGADVFANFSLPLLLDQMMEDTIVNGSEWLGTIVPGKETVAMMDLVQLPANQTGLSISRQGEIISCLKAAVQKKAIHSHWQDDPVPAKPLDFLKKLAGISARYDSLHLMHISTEPSIPAINPTWYTPNIVYYYGWRVLKFQKTTVLWNYFADKNRSLLAIKIPSQKLFAAILYKPDNLPCPTDYQKNDLLQSPLALAVLKTLYLKGREITFDGPTMDRIKDSPYNFLVIKDLIAHAHYYESLGEKGQANKLYRLYEDKFPQCIPVSYLGKPIIAGVNYAPDCYKATVPFEMAQNGKITVFASGQVSRDSNLADHKWRPENIELLIDVDHNRNKKFSLWDNHNQFRFNYRWNELSGEFHQNKNIAYAYTDPNDSTYILEIAIPWNSLNVAKPAVGKNIGLELLITDSDLDEVKPKSVLSWTIESRNDWNNPSRYGEMVLCSNPASATKNKCFCPKISHPPVIDGVADKLWNAIENVPIQQLAEGKISSSYDNSGMFKTAWDDNALYFLFTVTDNIKNKPGLISIDRCWIERAETGEPVWKMQGRDTNNYPTICISDTVSLKAGKYQLKYTTDDSHSFESWYCKIPDIDFYGAIIYPFTQ